MSVVIEGKLLKLEEQTYNSQRGPQTDVIAFIEQVGQESYPIQAIVSYKVVDAVKAIKLGSKVRVPLFTEVVPKGKNGPWVKFVGLEFTEIGG